MNSNRPRAAHGFKTGVEFALVEILGGGGLEAGEPVHRDDLDGVTPRLPALMEPLLEGLLGAALDLV